MSLVLSTGSLKLIWSQEENFALILVLYLAAYLIASMSTPARARLNHGLRDAKNVCALTKVGTVLKKNLLWRESWLESLHIYLLSFPRFWTLSIGGFHVIQVSFIITQVSRK